MKNTREERQMFSETVRFIQRKIERLQKFPVRGLMVRFAKPNAGKPEARAEGIRFGGTKRRFPQLALRALKQGRRGPSAGGRAGRHDAEEIRPVPGMPGREARDSGDAPVPRSPKRKLRECGWPHVQGLHYPSPVRLDGPLREPGCCEARAASRGNTVRGAKRRFPQLALRALKQGRFFAGSGKAAPSKLCWGSCREEKIDDCSV